MILWLNHDGSISNPHLADTEHRNCFAFSRTSGYWYFINTYGNANPIDEIEVPPTVKMAALILE